MEHIYNYIMFCFIDDEIEKTLTVLSDGEETMINFVEVPVEQVSR